jgi:hypothetical protein
VRLLWEFLLSVLCSRLQLLLPKISGPLAFVDKLFCRLEQTKFTGLCRSGYPEWAIRLASWLRFAKLDYQNQIRPDTVFYIASMSKQFTASGSTLSLTFLLDMPSSTTLLL